MTNTISAKSENYYVTVDSNNNAYIEKYNHPYLLACIYDKIRRAVMPQLTGFKALPEPIIEDINALEIIIHEDENRIIIRDKKTGISNRAIGFLR
jgi:hypothetical protein